MGIGTIKPSGTQRIFESCGRNKWWKNITNKTKWISRIVLESNDYQEVKNKEIELIKLYGRRDLGLGNLVNLTDGGEGLNKVISEEQKIKMLKTRALKKINWTKIVVIETDKTIKFFDKLSSYETKRSLKNGISYALNAIIIKEELFNSKSIDDWHNLLLERIEHRKNVASKPVEIEDLLKNTITSYISIKKFAEVNNLNLKSCYECFGLNKIYKKRWKINKVMDKIKGV